MMPLSDKGKNELRKTKAKMSDKGKNELRKTKAKMIKNELEKH